MSINNLEVFTLCRWALTVDKCDSVVEEVAHEDPVDDGGSGDGQQREEGSEVLPEPAHQFSAHLSKFRNENDTT